MAKSIRSANIDSSFKTGALTGIVTFSDFKVSSAKSAGSTFLRAEAIAASSDEFEIYQHGKKYDQLIFQKAYWREMMQLFSGPKILDLSDPDWLSGGVNIIELCNLVHAVTCSSPALTALMKTYLPGRLVYHVPDRLCIKNFPEPRGEHSERAKRVLWFGYIHNALETLPQLLPFILENRLFLYLVSNMDYPEKKHMDGISYQFIPYFSETIYQQIKESDIVLNPKSEKAFFKYKSNNKSLISWLLGVPVAETVEDLIRLADPANRNMQVVQMRNEVIGKYNILDSIADYKNIFSEIKKKYFC